MIWTQALLAILLIAPGEPEREQPTAEDETVYPGHRNELTAGWSPRVVIRNDRADSPLPYTGLGLGAFSLSYDRTRDADAHRVEVDFMKANLRARPDFEYLEWPTGDTLTAGPSPATYVRFKYAYLRSLPLPDTRAAERFSVRLGPGVDFDIQALEFVHGGSVLGGYLGAFALDARLEVEYRHQDKHRFRLDAALPAFGWVTRSPYAITDSTLFEQNRDHRPARVFFRYLSRGSVQSWNTYQGLRLAAHYDFMFRPRWALSTAAHMRVVANSNPRPLVAQELGVTIGMTVRF